MMMKHFFLLLFHSNCVVCCLYKQSPCVYMIIKYWFVCILHCITDYNRNKSISKRNSEECRRNFFGFPETKGEFYINFWLLLILKHVPGNIKNGNLYPMLDLSILLVFISVLVLMQG